MRCTGHDLANMQPDPFLIVERDQWTLGPDVTIHIDSSRVQGSRELAVAFDLYEQI